MTTDKQQEAFAAWLDGEEANINYYVYPPNRPKGTGTIALRMAGDEDVPLDMSHKQGSGAVFEVTPEGKYVQVGFSKHPLEAENEQLKALLVECEKVLEQMPLPIEYDRSANRATDGLMFCDSCKSYEDDDGFVHHAAECVVTRRSDVLTKLHAAGIGGE